MLNAILGAVAPLFLTQPAAVVKDTQPAAVVEERPAEKRICKTEVRIGSRIKTRTICGTAAEWYRVSEEIQQGVDDYGRTGSYGTIQPR